MALEAALDVGGRISRAVGPEPFVLPLTIAQVFGILGTPTRTLFHYDDPVQRAAHEAAIGVPHKFALLIQQRFESRQGEHRSARKRLSRSDIPERLSIDV